MYTNMSRSRYYETLISAGVDRDVCEYKLRLH